MHFPTPVLKRLLLAGGLVLACLFFSVSWIRAAQPKPTDDVLILYDSSGPYGWVGEMNARFLQNLLGHFPQTYQVVPIERYVSGDALRFRATFYLGNTFNNSLPSAFLLDVLATSKPVCWFKYNLWKLGTGTSFAAQFESKFGFRFEFMDSSSFPQIEFKGETFGKNQLDPELGRTTILNSARAGVLATARQLPSSNAIPYVVNGSNFWYVADIPFSYIDEEDRYLVFADLLHDIIKRDHSPSHNAIIRLEDVNPTYDADRLRAVADYLSSENVPFAVGVIPRYIDPRGYYNNGIPVDIRMSQKPDFVNALRYLVGKGGQLVMHGYTHQYADVTNPYTGVSADDYEFFRVVLDAQTNIVTYTPVPQDSTNWVQARLTAALQEFNAVGLTAVAWETPHYAASPLDYGVFASNFPLAHQRVLYADNTGHYAGQFFPYPIERDLYGQKLLPENLGNVDPYGSSQSAPRLPADLLRTARKNLVLRDGWAGAFFHPYLDLSFLRELVTGIKSLGYGYVPLTATVRPTIVTAPGDLGVTNGTRVVLNALAVGTAPLRYQWKFNGTKITGATNTNYTI